MLNITSKNNLTEEFEVIGIIKFLSNKYRTPLFTPDVVVEKGAIPHSHPILTLNTRVRDSRLLLDTLIHEQFHWYAQEHQQYKDCIEYLKEKYVDDGEHNKSGTYPNSYWEHIIVCFNTRNYLQSILPKDDIDWIYEQWQAYPTLERLIEEKGEEVRSDLSKFEIIYNGS